MRKYLDFKFLAVIVIALAASAAGEAGSLAAWGIVIVLTLLKHRENLIKAILLLLLLVFANSTIFRHAPQQNLLRWAVILIVMVRTLSYADMKVRVRKYGTVLVFCFAIIPSLLVSAYLSVSVTKLFIYCLGTLSVYLLIDTFPDVSRLALRTFLIVIVICSTVLVFSKIGYINNGHGFQGVLNHPQGFGIVMSIAVSFFIIEWINGYYGYYSYLNKILLILSSIFLILSESRTGLLASVLAITATMVLSNRTIFRQNLSKFTPIIFFTTIAFFVASAFVDTSPIGASIQKFLLKSGTQEYENGLLEIDDAFLVSRKGILENSWDSFLSHPITGIGFAMPSPGTSIIQANTFMGIPLEFPIEKSNIVTALMEETGIVGVFAFLLLLQSQLKKLIFPKTDPFLLLFLTVLFINLGEMAYFSIGGWGLLIQFCIGLALSRPSEINQSPT